MTPNNFTRKRKIFSLFLLLVFCLSLQAEDFTVKADKIETDTKNQIIYLYGHCTIEGKDIKLKADKIKIDKKKKVVTASGNVEFTKNSVKGSGEKFVYYTDSEQASIFKGELILESDYRFYAEEITYLSGNRYLLKNCTFTTCPKGCDYWGFYSNKVKVKKEGYASFKSLKFKVKEKPVFYLPFFIYPAKTQRTFGLLVPEFGNSSKHGFNYRQELFVPIGQSQDITLGIDYYSTAGTGTTFEYRESFRKGEFAKIKVYTIKDKLLEQRRSMGELTYNYGGKSGDTIQFSSFWGDDYNLIRDYTFSKYDLAMRDFYSYGGFFKTLSKHFSLSGSIYMQKPYFTDKIVYSSTLPSLTLYGENLSVLHRKIRFKANVALISDDKIENGTYSRNFLEIESSKYFGNSFFIGEEKFRVKSINYSDPILNDNTIFDFSYKITLPRLIKKSIGYTNIITPFFQTGYRDRSGTPTYFYHDLTDYVNPSGIYLKAGINSDFIFGNKTGIISLYGEKNLSSNTYPDPNMPSVSSEYSTFNAYFMFPVSNNLSISSLAKYNPKTNAFDLFTFNIGLYDLYLTYFRGYVYGEEESRNSLIGRYKQDISEHWKATVQFDYDFSLNDFRYKRLTLSYYKRCIGVNITYQNNSYSTTTTNQFTISLVLRSIGELFKYRLGL